MTNQIIEYPAATSFVKFMAILFNILFLLYIIYEAPKQNKFALMTVQSSVPTVKFTTYKYCAQAIFIIARL
jgi:hypothetical protein